MSDFPKKWASKLPDGFEDTVLSLGSEEVKEKILKCEETLMTIEREMDADEKLAVLKESVKDLAGGYREAMNCERAKIKYLMHTRSERGEI